jgi:hypothetical protein
LLEIIERLCMGIHEGSRIVPFNSIPTLREHISILPHALITDANHKYSFTGDGNEVCFHSPKILEKGSKPFDKWLDSMYRSFKEERSVQISTVALTGLRGDTGVYFGVCLERQATEAPCPSKTLS